MKLSPFKAIVLFLMQVSGSRGLCATGPALAHFSFSVLAN
jgi:hypothetical protein